MDWRGHSLEKQPLKELLQVEPVNYQQGWLPHRLIRAILTCTHQVFMNGYLDT